MNKFNPKISEQRHFVAPDGSTHPTHADALARAREHALIELVKSVFDPKIGGEITTTLNDVVAFINSDLETLYEIKFGPRNGKPARKASKKQPLQFAEPTTGEA